MQGSPGPASVDCSDFGTGEKCVYDSPRRVASRWTEGGMKVPEVGASWRSSMGVSSIVGVIGRLFGSCALVSELRAKSPRDTSVI
jgi:hypothetical protein